MRLTVYVETPSPRHFISQGSSNGGTNGRRRCPDHANYSVVHPPLPRKQSMRSRTVSVKANLPLGEEISNHDIHQCQQSTCTNSLNSSPSYQHCNAYRRTAQGTAQEEYCHGEEQQWSSSSDITKLSPSWDRRAVSQEKCRRDPDIAGC